MSTRSHPARDIEIGGLDIRAVGDCSCLRLRKAARRVTQFYDRCLEPAGLTIGQFGVLAHLLASAARGEDGCSMGTLADRLGVDPTTLKRTLAPLAADGLLAAGPARHDRRIRIVSLTDTGRAKLATAVPLWAIAQSKLEATLGGVTTEMLDRAVAAAYEKMAGA